MISPNGHQLYFVDQANWQVVVIDTVLHRYERLGRGTTHPSPDDEPEFGSFWKHIAGTGLSVLSYGEGLDLEDGDEGPDMEPEGQRLFLISPVPKPMFTSSDRLFPTIAHPKTAAQARELLKCNEVGEMEQGFRVSQQ